MGRRASESGRSGERRARGCGIQQRFPKGVYAVSFPRPHGASPGVKDPRKKANPILRAPRWLAYWEVPFPLFTEPQGRLSSLFHRFSLMARDPHSDRLLAAVCTVPRAAPQSESLLGVVLLTRRREPAVSSLGGRPAAWAGGAVRAACGARLRDAGARDRLPGWGPPPWGALRSSARLRRPLRRRRKRRASGPGQGCGGGACRRRRRRAPSGLSSCLWCPRRRFQTGCRCRGTSCSAATWS